MTSGVVVFVQNVPCVRLGKSLGDKPLPELMNYIPRGIVAMIATCSIRQFGNVFPGSGHNVPAVGFGRCLEHARIIGGFLPFFIMQRPPFGFQIGRKRFSFVPLVSQVVKNIGPSVGSFIAMVALAGHCAIEFGDSRRVVYGRVDRYRIRTELVR